MTSCKRVDRAGEVPSLGCCQSLAALRDWGFESPASSFAWFLVGPPSRLVLGVDLPGEWEAREGACWLFPWPVWVGSG